MSDEIVNLAAKAAELAARLADSVPAAPPLAPPAPPAPALLKSFRSPSSASGGGGGTITSQALRIGRMALNPVPQAPHPGDLLPTAFSFRVVFGEKSLKEETAFQELSGIGAQMQTEEVPEGGENRYVLQLPKGVKYQPLVLKRGIGRLDSALVQWCRSTLQGGLARQVQTVPLTIYLLDTTFMPLRGWLFGDAYPVKWDVGALDANKNEIALETISLCYTFCNRIL
jgi:phage tail-like protein